MRSAFLKNVTKERNMMNRGCRERIGSVAIFVFLNYSKETNNSQV
jgi:hypothetical protein